ncbi:hypothetical protein J2Y38_000245 [Flavobacterium sp. 2755]|uniref:transglycosylase domain-containing protein n=1 Tax=Flavobacterium sp. 2755 TaxID=2817765 RepID=UPI00286728A7|nr:transglycosylase domain-containing protein [Flavobacterium sp. 2755]MDR6760066.1 hypothetical protein [Flavobacterium sp. 2755]
MVKKSLKIFIGLVIILVITIAVLLSDFNPIYKNEEFLFITKELNNAQKEDFQAFIFTYNKIYEKIKEPSCPCQNAANNIRTDIRNTSLLKRTLYWLKIKKEFSHDECLKFVLINYDFGFDNIGIKDASKFYFKKDLEKLNEKEIITLVVIFRNSGLYNPIQNKKKLDAKVLLFEEILHNK